MANIKKRRGLSAIPLIGDFVYAWPRLLTYFLAGMVFAQFRDWIPLRRWMAGVALAVLLVTGLKTGGLHLAATAAEGGGLGHLVPGALGTGWHLGGRRGRGVLRSR